jgi:hypothetical protein
MFESIFVGKSVNNFKFKDMLRISKTWAFLLINGTFFENDVLTSKIMRNVNKSGP